MTQTPSPFGAKSYLLNLAAALGLVLLANAYIFVANRHEEDAQSSAPFAPPGYVIGIIWVFLFMAMSTSRWLSLRAGDRTAAHFVAVLALLCAVYPLYTQALRSLSLGLFGNIVTGVFAVVTAAIVFRRSFLGGSLISLVVVWLGFATYLILEQRKGR
jgi:translocator protein